MILALLPILLLILFPGTSARAQQPYWQQFVHYTMDVTLLPIEHSVLGEETIEYTNNSPDTLRQIFIHVYPNAYKDEHSLYAAEARRYFQKTLSSPREGGRLDIESFSIGAPNSQQGEMQKIDFLVRDTILEANLPRPLPPGGRLTLRLSFRNKVRQHRRRGGYRGFQYDMTQWYPKMCVYDENGWNARPFHFIGEFYGEFGTFDVTIRTPFEYVIGATGEMVKGDPGWKLVEVDTSISDRDWPERRKQMKARLREKASAGQMRAATFHAENVHDFAWSACPDFLYERGEWDGIPIHALYRSSARNRWSKTTVRRAARALAWLSQKFGRYPYPQLTVVHGLLGGGMEYPMLVMGSSPREGLILHEVGHIYFYGILGNNEWKEAWLDEGFTSFQTRWYKETRYGRWGFNHDLFQKRASWLQKRRPARTARENSEAALLSFMNSGHDEPISKPAETFAEQFTYARNVYTKAAFFYDMIKYVVGDSTFDRICRSYFEKWKFKHVNEARFRAVCEEVSGRDLGWLFDEWLRKTPTVDYALGKVKKSRVKDGWRTDVTLLRRADGIMPVEVEVATQNGKQRQRWDGVGKIGKLTFRSAEKPEKIMLDPDDRILDNRRSNNGNLTGAVRFEYPGLRPKRGAYLITWRPSGWHNRVDELRFGGRLRSRLGNYRNAELGLWYGSNSRNLDVRFKYSNPIKPLGARTRGFFLAQKMEGRQEIDAHLLFVKSRYLTVPPAHRIWVGFNHTKLRDPAYAFRELDRKQDVRLATWEKGTVNKAYLRYNVNPRGLDWFSSLTLGFDTVQKDWAGDFTFTSVFSEFKLWWPNPGQGLFARFFARAISNDSAPAQELIYLDGANPRARFNRFYLRSDGSLPEEVHYHLPGGGNVRGYYNNPVVGRRILALNLEGRTRAPRFLPRLTSRSSATLAAFVDLATMDFDDAGGRFYADAGLGLRLKARLPDEWYTLFTGGRNVALRFDFPIWVNKPLPDEKPVRFRWVMGFEADL